MGKRGLKKMIKGNYSAAILDYEMPKLNGLDLFNKVCEEGLPVKDSIIFYTGKTCKDLLRNLEKLKVPYLIKPGELSKLKEQIAFYCKDATG